VSYLDFWISASLVWDGSAFDHFRLGVLKILSQRVNYMALATSDLALVRVAKTR
jgi:hypothetical protein